jgi:hypothetical protein
VATSSELYQQASAHQAKADRAREAAVRQRRHELLETPIGDRLIYAATERCHCGAGMAYDPAVEGREKVVPIVGPTRWECSDILRYRALSPERQAAAKAATHSEPLPFVCWEVKSENQPSANGASTRPADCRPAS